MNNSTLTALVVGIRLVFFLVGECLGLPRGMTARVSTSGKSTISTSELLLFLFFLAIPVLVLDSHTPPRFA